MLRACDIAGGVRGASRNAFISRATAGVGGSPSRRPKLLIRASTFAAKNWTVDGHAFKWRIKNARLGVQPIERYHLAKNQTADVAPRAPRCSPPECKRIRNDGVQQDADLRAANWILRMKRPARRERQACRLVTLHDRSMCK